MEDAVIQQTQHKSLLTKKGEKKRTLARMRRNKIHRSVKNYCKFFMDYRVYILPVEIKTLQVH